MTTSVLLNNPRAGIPPELWRPFHYVFDGQVSKDMRGVLPHRVTEEMRRQRQAAYTVTALFYELLEKRVR